MIFYIVWWKNLRSGRALFGETIDILYSLRWLKSFRSGRCLNRWMVFQNFQKKMCSFEKTLRKRYFLKVLIFHKVWSQVFEVVGSESMISHKIVFRNQWIVFRNFQKISWFEKAWRQRYFVKVIIFHKVLSKIFEVVESESMISFSKFWKTNFLLEKTLRKRYLEKLLIFYIVWWKVFEVVGSKSMNSFSKFWKRISSFEKTLMKRYFVKVIIFHKGW